MANQILDREIADNKLKVGEYVLSFLNDNNFCKQITSEWMQEWYSSGIFDKDIFEKNSQITNIVPLFMGLAFEEISSLKNSDKNQFEKTLNRICQKDLDCLEGFYQLSQKYKLEPEDIKKDFKKCLAKINNDNDQKFLLFYMFFEAIFYSMAIILGKIFEDWYKEKYVYTKK